VGLGDRVAAAALDPIRTPYRPIETLARLDVRRRGVSHLTDGRSDSRASLSEVLRRFSIGCIAFSTMRASARYASHHGRSRFAFAIRFWYESGMHHDEMVPILDFGAQYAQLIARRVRAKGVYSELVR